MGGFPQLQPFVNGDKVNIFKNFSSKNVRGAMPRLKLLDQAGNVVEELNIEKWDTDTVEAFLREKLMD